jgi:hypothetical protein
LKLPDARRLACGSRNTTHRSVNRTLIREASDGWTCIVDIHEFRGVRIFDRACVFRRGVEGCVCIRR